MPQPDSPLSPALKYTFSLLLERLDNAGVFPAGTDRETRRGLLNEAIEAAILSGRWNGTQAVILVTVDQSGILTLPRQFLTCKGVKINGNVRQLASPWYSFLQNTSDLSQWSTNVRDLGTGACVFKQPKESAQLRFVSGSDATSVIEVHGTDANGEVYNGSQHGILLTAGAAKTGSHFTKVTDLIKPVTDQPGQLYACYDDNTEEIIGSYEPGEEVPDYRQYLIQEATSCATTDSTTAVEAFVQRQHVDLVADNDVCPIKNFRALKNLVRHIVWENNDDETRSDKALNNAIAYLNMEAKLLRPPSEIGAVRVNAMATGANGLHQFR